MWFTNRRVLEEVKLPHATIFKPHRPYENHLHETFRNLQQSAYKLLEIFLSVEPQRRGIAASALASEYFKTKPFACDPSSLPKYPPTKEIDARTRAVEVARRPLRVHRDPQDSSGSSRLSNNTETESNMNNNATDSSNEKLACPRVTGDTRFFVDLQPVAALKPPYQVRHVKHISQGDIPFSGPLHVNPSSGFAWVEATGRSSPG
ncbi:hypothetical protein HPP92_023356 [Vanilla planifolia]|uniref:Uncharacterized protein n=1 Tax=Vanilla planifolia TaxID=51239 RepID=A0A835PWF9_VANPL|nr:hypothetical protein HPP92_023356 [Vanilla planifolia]